MEPHKNSHKNIHHGKLILVVEDDADMRSLICDAMQDVGLQIMEAVDGKAALQKSHSIAPHVVLTDLRMPHGGVDYLKALRVLLPSTPLIVLTAFGDREAQAEAAAVGVNVFLTKPIRLEDLQRAVRAVLDAEDEHTMRGPGPNRLGST